MKLQNCLPVATMAICIAAGSALASPPDLSVDKPFPSLVLPALQDGRPMSIADFRGQKVILHVFASW